jgi:hypothetical protein
MVKHDPYSPVKQFTQKEVWLYEEPEGLQLHVADGKNKDGLCVGIITWKYIEGALRRKKERR